MQQDRSTDLSAVLCLHTSTQQIFTYVINLDGCIANHVIYPIFIFYFLFESIPVVTYSFEHRYRVPTGAVCFHPRRSDGGHPEQRDGGARLADPRLCQQHPDAQLNRPHAAGEAVQGEADSPPLDELSPSALTAPGEIQAIFGSEAC